jgi:hypothetical protein
MFSSQKPTTLLFDFDVQTSPTSEPRFTFEVLMASFELDGDPALERIGALIQYLDVGGVPVPVGLEARWRGARDALSDDDGLLAEAGSLLDYLYAHCAATA